MGQQKLIILFYKTFQKIYGDLIENLDDEITIFKTVEQNKRFVVGNHKGELTMHNYNNGEKIKVL